MPSPFRCNLFLLGGLKPKLLYLEFHVDFALREHMALTHVIFCREKPLKCIDVGVDHIQIINY